MVQACSPGTTAQCEFDHGVGIKTCMPDGLSYGACVFVACNNGYAYNNPLAFTDPSGETVNICAPDCTSFGISDSDYQNAQGLPWYLQGGLEYPSISELEASGMGYITDITGQQLGTVFWTCDDPGMCGVAKGTGGQSTVPPAIQAAGTVANPAVVAANKGTTTCVGPGRASAVGPHQAPYTGHSGALYSATSPYSIAGGRWEL